jgi:hypothetical protein
MSLSFGLHCRDLTCRRTEQLSITGNQHIPHIVVTISQDLSTSPTKGVAVQTQIPGIESSDNRQRRGNTPLFGTLSGIIEGQRGSIMVALESPDRPE